MTQTGSTENRFLTLFLLYIIQLANGIPPAQVPAPTVTITGETTLEVSFDSISDATQYHVSISRRHGTTKTEQTTTSTSIPVANLTGSTLYDVSIRAENAAGEIGEESNSTAKQTHPSPPTIHTNTLPLPNAALMFFDTPNKARVSQWLVEYREFDSNIVFNTSTESGEYYSLGLSNLLANTVYEVRARAAQIDGNISLTESESRFSEWQNLTTGLLEAFGRVDLVDVNYTSNHSVENSEEWNTILANLSDAYSASSIRGIRILEVGESPDIAGKTRVFYVIEVLDTQLPSSTNLTLTGPQYANFFLNNEPSEADPESFLNLLPDSQSFQLQYFPINPSISTVDFRIIVTPENDSTQKIPLTQGEVEGSGDGRIIAKKVTLESKSLIESDSTTELLDTTANTVLGFTTEFLIRDNFTDIIYKVYRNDIFINETSDGRKSRFFFTSSLDDSILIVSDVSYVSSSDGTEVTLNLPAVDKAVKYEILDGNIVIATLQESGIDGSDMVKIIVPSLVNGTTYNFTVKVTTRKQSGSEETFTLSNDRITVTPIAPVTTDPSTVTTVPTAFTTDPNTAMPDPITVPIDPTTSMTDPTTARTDSTTVIIDPTTNMTDPTTSMTDPTTARTDPTTFTIDPTINMTAPITNTTGPTTATTMTDQTTNMTDPTTAMTGPITVRFDPTKNMTDPTTATTIIPTITACVFESGENEDFTPTLSELTGSSIHVTWREVPNVNTYAVFIQCINCENDGATERIFLTNVANFNNLEAGCTYEVCVTAELCFGGNRTLTSKCDRTTLVPSAITYVNVTVGVTSAHFEWEIIKGAQLYIVSFEIADNGNQRKRNILTSWKDPVSSPYIETKLAPETTYIFSVVASNAAGAGTPFEGSFTTKSLSTTTKSSFGTKMDSSTKSVENPTSIDSKPTTPTTTAKVSGSSTATLTDISASEIPSSTLSSTSITSPDLSSTVDSDAPASQSSIIYTTTMTNTAKSDVLEPTTVTLTVAPQSNTMVTTPAQSSTATDRSGTESTELISGIGSTDSNTDQSTLTMKTERDVPWWFILAIVLAALILIACIIAVVMYQRKTKKN